MTDAFLIFVLQPTMNGRVTAMGHNRGGVAAALAACWLAGAAHGATPLGVCEALRDHPADRTLLAQLRQAISESAQDPRHTAYMAAYSLGCLHAGMLDEGRRTREFLTARMASDPAVARLATGRLDVSCSACGGAPQGRSACRICGGAGKAPSPSAVEREYRALLDELTGHAPPPPPPPPAPAATATSAVAWDDMRGFVAMMQTLREQARGEALETVDLATVIASPRPHAGRAIRSSGFVIGYHARQITVSPESDLASRQRLDFTPDSLYVGTKAGTAFRSTGRPVPVTLVFALVEGHGNVAFVVEPVKEAKNQ